MQCFHPPRLRTAICPLCQSLISLSPLLHSVGLTFSCLVFLVGLIFYLAFGGLGKPEDVPGGQRMNDLCALVRRGIRAFSTKTFVYFGTHQRSIFHFHWTALLNSDAGAGRPVLVSIFPPHPDRVLAHGILRQVGLALLIPNLFSGWRELEAAVCSHAHVPLFSHVQTASMYLLLSFSVHGPC